MKRLTRIFSVILLIVLVSSCKKKTPEDIGLPLLPGEDLLNASFIDTLTLITHTVRDDSLMTRNTAPILLGNMNDPVFGITRSSIFTQISLSKANPAFGTSPVLDSVVLSMVINNGEYYGSLTGQQFSVYPLTERMYFKDTLYYSNQKLQNAPTSIGTGLLIPNAKDSVMVDTLKYPPHLRLNLDTNYFKGLFSSTSLLASNAALQDSLFGFYIVSETDGAPGQGAILYLDLTHLYSRITMFYHNTTDTTSFYFGFGKDQTARYAYFEHDHASSPDIMNQLSTPDSIQEDKIFIQPMAGLRAKITMPTLPDMFGGKKVAINKAEMIISLNSATTDSTFKMHKKLVLTIADPELGTAIIPDFFEGTSYFGGDYNVVSQEYRFNIARYVQQVLSGTIDNDGLYLITNARLTTAERVELIGGRKSLVGRMRLKITYTLL